MIQRKLLMKGMLWSLGVAAVAGVLGILAGGDDLVGRVVATALTTAVACLLMLGMAKMVDRQATRSAGLLGMSTVLTEFVLAMSGIWVFSSRWFGYRSKESIYLTMICVAWAAVPAIGLVKLSSNAVYRVGAWTGVVFCGLYLGSSLLGTWLPGSLWDHDEWWTTAWMFFLAMPVFVTLLIGVGVDPGRHWRWLGVVSGVVACGIALGGFGQSRTVNPRCSFGPAAWRSLWAW